MLSSAGRHEEALRNWDRLVAQHPKVADAHLNRAVTAANAGRHDLAVEAAAAGLQHFPGHARLIATKAMALKNIGRIEEAVSLFEIAVAADPERALTRHNQAVTLRAACRYDEACEAYAEAERLGMHGAQFHANWAAAALEAGCVEEATDLYKKALAEDPAHKESRKALTRLEIEYRGGGDAFAHYEAEVRARGFAAEPYLDWIDALMRNNRPVEAAEVASEALSRHPDQPTLRTIAPYLKGMTGKPGPWLDALEEEAVRRPGDTHLADSIQMLSIRAGRWDRAEELLRQQLARDPDNQLVWAKLSIVWRMLDDPREHWLCDYDRLVMVTEVPSPDGLLDPAQYARIMATALDPLHQTRHAPGDQTLRGGTQSSGDLFARLDPKIQGFRKAILLAAGDMVAALPADPAHPFLRRTSDRLGFSGSWSVRLQSGGHHVSHVHSEGWMSSAYYARLPETTEQAPNPHEGWIQFGVPPDNFGMDLEPRLIIEPKPGRLVLFPSYMWHGTIPFQSGDRLTAAFDYLPL
nr:putative 2OG-Fe(II) oxygenase [Sphingomonas alba]